MDVKKLVGPELPSERLIGSWGLGPQAFLWLTQYTFSPDDTSQYEKHMCE